MSIQGKASGHNSKYQISIFLTFFITVTNTQLKEKKRMQGAGVNSGSHLEGPIHHAGFNRVE